MHVLSLFPSPSTSGSCLLPVGSISGISPSRGPKLGILEHGNMARDFTHVRALLMEVKPYVLLLIVFIWGVVQSTCIYHEIVLMNIRCCLLTSLASIYIAHQRPRD